MYLNGFGVPQDYTEAVKWIRLASEQGFSDAQNNIGVIYANGEGFAQDLGTAFMWASISHSNGLEQDEALAEQIMQYLSIFQTAAPPVSPDVAPTIVRVSPRSRNT